MAQNFGSILSNLSISSLQSIRQNATGDAFEAYTPSAGGGNPGGSDTQMQFNDGGSFGGASVLTWHKNASVLTIVNPSIASFSQAQHTHKDGSGGGQLDGSSVFSMTGGQIQTSVLGTGTASGTTFLRGDSTWSTPSGGGGGVNVQSFIGAGTYTWTKPSGANVVNIYLIGGGGGGGSGCKGASGALLGGGSGGGGAGYAARMMPAAVLGSTEVVYVGAGGGGGSTISANSTQGTAGGPGQWTTFGSSSILNSLGGNAGNFGSVAGGGAGANNVGAVYFGALSQTGNNSGGGGNATNGVSIGNSTTFLIPKGGGGGAGINAVPSAFGGGKGSGSSTITALFGGIGGSPSTDGAEGASVFGEFIGGSGGGGGGSSTTTNAGAGGAGLVGSGGGGGGASLNGVGNSGAGGKGGDGIAIIITYT